MLRETPTRSSRHDAVYPYSVTYSLRTLVYRAVRRSAPRISRTYLLPSLIFLSKLFAVVRGLVFSLDVKKFYTNIVCTRALFSLQAPALIASDPRSPERHSSFLIFVIPTVVSTVSLDQTPETLYVNCVCISQSRRAEIPRANLHTDETGPRRKWCREFTAHAHPFRLEAREQQCRSGVQSKSLPTR